MITLEQLNKDFKYDRANGVLVRKTANCNRVNVGDIVGSANSAGYQTVWINGKNRYVHRVIYFMLNGVYDLHIDHIDQDKSNNKIENLRACTQSQNNRNIKSRSDNKSGFKGVSWSKAMKKWHAKVNSENRVVVSMYFDCLELAGLVASEGRNKYHKEFASC